MQKSPITKYKPWGVIDLPDRQWPNRVIERAPQWCSVDLRDGNQALPIPMGIKEKLELFKLLCQVGFEQIEIGFPSAAQTEFDFRMLQSWGSTHSSPFYVAQYYLVHSPGVCITGGWEPADNGRPGRQ